MKHDQPLSVGRIFVELMINPRTYKGVGVDATPPKVFLNFFLEDKTSAPDVFSNCSLIPRAHFESSSVIVSFYDYKI